MEFKIKQLDIFIEELKVQNKSDEEFVVDANNNRDKYAMDVVIQRVTMAAKTKDLLDYTIAYRAMFGI